MSINSRQVSPAPPKSSRDGKHSVRGAVIFCCFVLISLLPLVWGVATGRDKMELTLGNLVLLYFFYRGHAWACVLLPTLVALGAAAQLIVGVRAADAFAFGYGFMLLWMFLSILFSQSLRTFLKRSDSGSERTT
jgi:hypothetical protein